MVDVFSKEKRSDIMSKIKSKDTKIEVLVRKWLFQNGFRYRKNDKRYAGTPDLVLPKYKTAIFINGCFWHGHEGCTSSRLPKSKLEYWETKINRTRERDRQKKETLEELGWNVITIWECDLKKDSQSRLTELINEIKATTLKDQNYH